MISFSCPLKKKGVPARSHFWDTLFSLENWESTIYSLNHWLLSEAMAVMIYGCSICLFSKVRTFRNSAHTKLEIYFEGGNRKRSQLACIACQPQPPACCTEWEAAATVGSWSRLTTLKCVCSVCHSECFAESARQKHSRFTLFMALSEEWAITRRIVWASPARTETRFSRWAAEVSPHGQNRSTCWHANC